MRWKPFSGVMMKPEFDVLFIFAHTAVLSEAWAKLRAEPLILPRDVHDSLLEVGQRENNKR